MKLIKLSELNDDLLQKFDSWRVLEETYDDEDVSLSPAYKNNNGEISNKNGEVRCLSKAIFANGEVHKASSMCRGDSNEGPLLSSVWNKTKWINLLLPPAPDFVLKKEGLINFCATFNKPPDEVFPIQFEVIPKFQIEPNLRTVTIYQDGTISNKSVQD